MNYYDISVQDHLFETRISQVLNICLLPMLIYEEQNVVVKVESMIFAQDSLPILGCFSVFNY